MFGCDAKIGLSTSSLPHGLLCSLESEEDLVEHLNRAEEEGNDLRAPAQDYSQQITWITLSAVNHRDGDKNIFFDFNLG